ncbi:hypothetical protein A0H76_992 [Hepatospora eriocheir]|uniref:Uncharacterized protein n=1 Tax=Hepatospora eriocheir TaxID=1081669 RepID=A0A1X0QHT7_9MICR|nr:hypothetical protein A0H76_992 [Hepatospora eriocheir]
MKKQYLPPYYNTIKTYDKNTKNKKNIKKNDIVFKSSNYIPLITSLETIEEVNNTTIHEIENINPNNLNFNKKSQDIYNLEFKQKDIREKLNEDFSVFIEKIRELPDFLEKYKSEYDCTYQTYKGTLTEYNLQIKLIESQTESNKKLTKTNEELKEKIIELEKENLFLKTENVGLKTYKNEVEPFIEILKSNLSNKDNLVDKFTIENNELKSANSKLGFEKDLLMQEISNYKQQNKQLSNDINNVRNEIDLINKSFISLRNNLYSDFVNNLIKTNINLTTKYKNMSVKLGKFTTMIDKTLIDNVSLTNIVDNLQTILNNYKYNFNLLLSKYLKMIECNKANKTCLNNIKATLRNIYVDIDYLKKIIETYNGNELLQKIKMIIKKSKVNELFEYDNIWNVFK